MVKVAFVGCGEAMAGRAAGLAGMAEVRMAGFCDIDRARAEAAAQAFGGRPFTQHTELFEQTKPDAVIICTPPLAHGPIEESAAQHRVHLFVAGPVALERAAAKRTAAAIRAAGLIAGAGSCLRYSEAAFLARGLLKGRAVSLVTGMCSAAPPEPGWKRCKKSTGGLVMARAWPFLDLVRYWCGEVSEVFATASNGAMSPEEEHDIEDSCVISLRMKNGAVASLACSCVANHAGRAELEVVTPESTFLFRERSLWVAEEGKTTEYHHDVDPVAAQMRSFIEAVRSGSASKMRGSYADAVKTVAVACAANESMRSGISVKP